MGMVVLDLDCPGTCDTRMINCLFSSVRVATRSVWTMVYSVDDTVGLEEHHLQGEGNEIMV